MQFVAFMSVYIFDKTPVFGEAALQGREAVI